MKLFSIVRMTLNAITKPKQHILIQEIPKGRLIDIGGGGEGVIARAGGAEVVAIDKYLSEIHEARGKATDASWMVADATRLPFKSQSFENATAFFSCMYMPNEVKEKVFRETRRVLKTGGEFWIWDVPMSFKSKVFAIRLQMDYTLIVIDLLGLRELPWQVPIFGGVWAASPPTHPQIWSLSRRIPMSRFVCTDL